jgi:hypothetical protein
LSVVTACDFCGRLFGRQWLVGASGSMVKCLHCYFSTVWVEPWLAARHTDREWRDLGQSVTTKADSIAKNGLLAFLRHALDAHDGPTCPWGGRERCVLCAASAAGLRGADDVAMADWVARTFPQPSASTEPRYDLRSWDRLTSRDQLATASALAASLDLGLHVIERAGGAPWFQDETGAEWVVRATTKGAHLLGRALATRGLVGKLLGRVMSEPDDPWLGFDRHDLPPIIAHGLEISSVQPRSADISPVPHGLFQVVAMGHDWIEIADRLRRRQRVDVSHLDARDALGRLQPSLVPPTVGVRLARRIVATV